MVNDLVDQERNRSRVIRTSERIANLHETP
jgi:hypothetical protein